MHTGIRMVLVLGFAIFLFGSAVVAQAKGVTYDDIVELYVGLRIMNGESAEDARLINTELSPCLSLEGLVEIYIEHGFIYPDKLDEARAAVEGVDDAHDRALCEVAYRVNRPGVYRAYERYQEARHMWNYEQAQRVHARTRVCTRALYRGHTGGMARLCDSAASHLPKG